MYEKDLKVLLLDMKKEQDPLQQPASNQAQEQTKQRMHEGMSSVSTSATRADNGEGPLVAGMTEGRLVVGEEITRDGGRARLFFQTNSKHIILPRKKFLDS